MTIKAKVRRLKRLKQQTRELEREILNEGFMLMQKPGETLLMKPRIERVMEMFG